MGRARPATNICHCVEIGITDTSNKKNQAVLYGKYYFESPLKAQKSLASQNINTLSPTNPADPAYACFVYMLATASSPSS